MTWRIDAPIRIGDTIFAAIVEIKIKAETIGPSICGIAEKQPLLFLQFSSGKITGLDVNGHGYEEDEIELLYPNAIAQIREQQINLQ